MKKKKDSPPKSNKRSKGDSENSPDIFDHPEDNVEEQIRTLDEIGNAIDELIDKKCYVQYLCRLAMIESGEVKVVEKYSADYSSEITREALEIAGKNAERIEKKFADGNLGPWDDFELGAINGKLSALRWVLGDQWDNLDT